MDLFRPWARRKPTPDPSSPSRVDTLSGLRHVVVIPASEYDRMASADLRAQAAEERELETRRLLGELVQAVNTAPISTWITRRACDQVGQDGREGMYVNSPLLTWRPSLTAMQDALRHLGRVI